MSRTEKILWVPAIALLLVSAYVHVVCGNATDKNWLLVGTRMMLEGKKLYVDIIEVNPPLILWLYSMPVWLSMHLPLPDFEILALFGFALAGAVVFACHKLIVMHPAFAGNARWQRAFALLLRFYVFRVLPPRRCSSWTASISCFHAHLPLYVLRFAPSFATSRPRMTLAYPHRAACRHGLSASSRTH